LPDDGVLLIHGWRVNPASLVFKVAADLLIPKKASPACCHLRMIGISNVLFEHSADSVIKCRVSLDRQPKETAIFLIMVRPQQWRPSPDRGSARNSSIETMH